MASYHFKNQIFKRSQGDSSIAAAAYRSGERLYDEKQQRFHDYRSRKGSVAHTEILAPEGSAAFLLDRQQLWQHVEDLEKRKDAQLSREFELALPKELTPDQRLSCVRDFIKDECVSRGMRYIVQVSSALPSLAHFHRLPIRTKTVKNWVKAEGLTGTFEIFLPDSSIYRQSFFEYFN